MVGAVLILGTTNFGKKFINSTEICSTLKRKNKMNSILKHLSAISLTTLLSLGQGFSGEMVIGFGSCLDQDLPQPIWKDIKAQNPEVFIMLGDNVYGDTYGNIQKLERAYQNQARAFEKAGLGFPFLAIWDDHDYGKNDGGVEYSQKDESQKLFLKFWDLPEADRRHRNRGLSFEEIIHSKEGTVQILMLDTRYFRSPLKRSQILKKSSHGRYEPDYDTSKTMLGRDQWKWLTIALKREADLRILGTSIQLLAEGHGWERWGNLPLERQRLLNLLAQNSDSNLIVISGDRHLGGIYSLRTKEGIEFLEITSSSMNKPGSLTNEPDPLRIGGMYAGENFGIIRIDFQRRKANIELHGLNEGVVLSKTLNFDKTVLKGKGL